MVIWDLPNLKRGVKALKTSRLGFAYRTISPQVPPSLSCGNLTSAFRFTCIGRKYRGVVPVRSPGTLFCEFNLQHSTWVGFGCSCVTYGTAGNAN